MANRLKSDKRTTKKKPDQLKPEKEAQVKMKELVRDERTHKIAGSLLILLAAFLFIAFTSYIFTWKQDQDKVFRQGAAVLLPSANVKTSNLLGNIGAYISHQFFYNGFGLASFAFCTFFFTLGANFLTGRRIFSIRRNLRYVLLGGLLLSVSLAFLAGNSSFSWGGAVGKMISDWLIRLLGIIGAASLLMVIYLAYFIWRFNPVFRVPKLPSFEKSARLTIDDEVAAEENEMPDVVNTNRLKNPDAAMKGTVEADDNDFDENILLTEKEGDTAEELADRLAADAPLTVHEMLQRGMKPNELNADDGENALPEEAETEEEAVPVPAKTTRNRQPDAGDLQLE
ncbi:MAG TPA: DNA translocase FtsK 4TM domain-containing protein, partial [Chitinophagaceae bacterium]|nr:DNA translocase FtsK 4TM domain-containing protein [Chitinophagaceae bacterium]